MKITYNKNPLYTTIELDEHEKQILWHKIRYQHLEDLMFRAHFFLMTGESHYSVESARSAIDPGYYIADGVEKSALDTYCDSMLEYYINELKQSHWGDCTADPCSCGKCQAERLLEINTLNPQPAKHVLVKLVGAFGNENELSIDEAIAHLESYEPNANWKGYEVHDYRWKAEAAMAIKYLENYRNKHFLSKGE